MQATGPHTRQSLTALSLTQPWASLVVWGFKGWETRGFSVTHRGPLVIQAAKGFPGWAIDYCYDELFASALRQMGILHPKDLPRGMVVGVVDLVGCLRTEQVRASIGYQEVAFGDYSDGRWAWRLRNPRRLSAPIEAKGSLGLWQWEPPVSFEGMLVAS